MEKIPTKNYESSDPLERLRDNLNASWDVGAFIENGELFFSMLETDIRYKQIEEKFSEEFDIENTETSTQSVDERGGQKMYLIKMKPKTHT